MNDERAVPEEGSSEHISPEPRSPQDRFREAVGGLAAAKLPQSRSAMALYRRRLILSDVLVVAGALFVGLAVSSRQSAWEIDPLLAIYGTPLLIGIVWFASLGLRGSYDERIIGLGTEEIRRVLTATIWTFAIVAGTSYLVRGDISRAYAFVTLPLGVLIIAGSRFGWRNWLYRARERGEFQSITLVIGAPEAAAQLAAKLSRDSFAGYRVASTMDIPGVADTDFAHWLDQVDLAIRVLGVQAIAVVASDTTPDAAVRNLAWRLEGRNIDLLIAPAMLEIAGPRLSVRPASGLPLLHLDEISLTKAQRVAKRSFDVIGSTLLILLLSPVLLGCSIAVRFTSGGPVIFKQRRIGRNGIDFTMLKFRTMVTGAEAMKDNLRDEHDLDDPMFKLSDDPRITSAGRFLRRWSLDELPQLFNVFGGSMSLVGPRPHPLDDVSRYETAAFRRLALKPGMTGLWQVEGRSDLDWADSLQLDLYYVESWTMAGDIVLMLRTTRAVIQGRGAV